jgi:16S rRNA (cytosine967-C5)-methyltransferase
VYQLDALDRVPVHAAVDTTVSLARTVSGVKAAGFVNAVLRKVAVTLSREMATPGNADLPASHPDWLVRRWRARFGEAETRALMQWNDTPPPLILQPARWSLEELEACWAQAGIDVHPAPFGAGLFTNVRRPEELPGFAEGAFVVQDPAQALVMRYWDLPVGAAVYDACAAPGGKAIAAGLRVRTVVAADRSGERIQRLVENLRRAGSGREYVVRADAAAPPVRQLDAVILDAPCLGTGTLARHPEARWRVNRGALDGLTREGAVLLDALADRVRAGGLLLYASCSIEPEENGEQVSAFLASHPDFRRAPTDAVPAELRDPLGDLMILPQRHGMDGAYAARLQRAG